MHSFLKFIFGIKLYMFRTIPLSIIRTFSLYTQQWYDILKFHKWVKIFWRSTEELSENKLEILLHLVGFIVRIYHGVRSTERKICVFHLK